MTQKPLFTPLRFLVFCMFLAIFDLGLAQVKNEYEISFNNAHHHEAEIKGKFVNLQSGTVSFRMSRTSPGRYALHEFAKNVYNVKFTNSKGKDVTVTRPNPHQWDVAGHDGTINVKYTLFGNRADGTYVQIDETHALLNIPASFMFVPALSNRPVNVRFKVREDLNWKVATQLIPADENTYIAPNLDYFMDSPVLLSDHSIREYKVESLGKEYSIKMALDHLGTESEFDAYFANVKKIVDEQRAVFGDFPKFDYGQYIFLASYRPQVSGDGMEHRNSTVLTSSTGLSEGGMSRNIGTVSHEFFHAWNAERLRPRSLEPFDYEDANISGELWFAEGFTSYYDDLVLCRAGIISEDEYIEKLTSTYNRVWGSPGTRYFNPIGMSYQAPLVDGARWVDEVNRGNTFISYYSYGSMLALALDLTLRAENDGLTLDGYMRQLWTKYGNAEIPYTVENLYLTLRDYAGDKLADSFFEDHIYASGKPDYGKLFEVVGLNISLVSAKSPYIGAEITFNESDIAIITGYTKVGSPAYEAGLERGDIILSVAGSTFSDQDQLINILSRIKPGKKVNINFQRHGKERTATLRLGSNPTAEITKSGKAKSKALNQQADWLSSKAQ